MEWKEASAQFLKAAGREDGGGRSVQFGSFGRSRQERERGEGRPADNGAGARPATVSIRSRPHGVTRSIPSDRNLSLSVISAQRPLNEPLRFKIWRQPCYENVQFSRFHLRNAASNRKSNKQRLRKLLTLLDVRPCKMVTAKL